MAMAISRTIYIRNVVCCSQINIVHLNIVALIINLHNQFTINCNLFVT